MTRYLPDVFGDAAIRFIREKSSKPFFLHFSFSAPHEPMEAEEYLKRFTHLAKPNDKPITNRGKQIAHPRQVYAAMMFCLDDSIGRILDVLKDISTNRKFPTTISSMRVSISAMCQVCICP